MRSSLSPRRLAAGVLSLTLAGSVLATATAGTAQAAGSAHVPTTHVKITKYHNVKMPTTLRPGLNRLVIRSTREAGFQLIRAKKGYTKAEAVRDANRMFENVRAMRRFERNTVLLGGMGTRAGEPAILWTRLPAGRYWALDTYAETTKFRRVHDVRVAGDRVPGRLPGARTIRATGEVDWASRPKVIPRSGILRFRNDSTDNHFLELTRLKKGKTVADFREWVEGVMNGVEAPPPVVFSDSLHSGLVSSGKTMSQRYELRPGNYVLMCWWPDTDMDLMPHVFMGMYRGVTVR